MSASASAQAPGTWKRPTQKNAVAQNGAAQGLEAQPAGAERKPVKAKVAAKSVPAVAQPNVDTLKRRLMRLALDVHDRPMQNLAVIGISLGDLRRRMHALVPEEHHTKIDTGMEQISAELGRVESELRALITALEHGGTKTMPLVEAIEIEIREFQRHSSPEVELAIAGEPQAETDSQRIALQSVTRAALANVAKHANAKNVGIKLTGRPDTVTLEIEDDGSGFSTRTPTPGRFGLTGMKERVELLGG